MIVDSIFSMLSNIVKKNYEINDDFLYGNVLNIYKEEFVEDRILKLDNQYNEIHTPRLILQGIHVNGLKGEFYLEKDKNEFANIDFVIEEDQNTYKELGKRNIQFLRFAILLKSIDRYIGEVEIRWDMENNKAQIGYGVSSSFKNNGYATEAVKSILEFSFYILGVNRVEACHYEGNFASKRVLIKSGMNFEGCSYQAVRVDGVTRDLYRYSILKKHMNR